MDHVEMHQQEGARLHDVRQHHAVRRDRMGIKVAAGLNARRPHVERRFVREVEADQVAGQVVASAG